MTVLNNKAIEIIRDWTIYDQESCSDHIIKYELGKGNDFFRHKGTSTAGTRHRVTKRDTGKFRESLIHIMEKLLTGINTAEVGVDKLDEALCQRIQSAPNIEEMVEEFQEALDKACKSSFRLTRTNSTSKKTT